MRWRRGNSVQAVSRLPDQQGISLMEVLIALLLLAVGVMGAGAMQLNALRYNASAVYSTQASIIAYDVLERMRVNSAQLSSYAIQIDSCTDGLPVDNSILHTDLADFSRAVGCQLPGGSGRIEIQGARATVHISWSEQRLPQEAALSQIKVSSLLPVAGL